MEPPLPESYTPALPQCQVKIETDTARCSLTTSETGDIDCAEEVNQCGSIGPLTRIAETSIGGRSRRSRRRDLVE